MRIRRPEHGEPGDWPAPGGPVPEAPYGLGAEPPAAGPYPPSDSNYPYAPGLGYPYQENDPGQREQPGAPGYPYPEPAGAAPDPGTGYLYVSQGGPPAYPAEPPPDYPPYDPPELYGYERGRGSFAPQPPSEWYSPDPRPAAPGYAGDAFEPDPAGPQGHADPGYGFDPAHAPEAGYGPGPGYEFGSDPGYPPEDAYTPPPAYDPAGPALPGPRPGPPGYEFGYEPVPEPVRPRRAADDLDYPPGPDSYGPPGPDPYGPGGSVPGMHLDGETTLAGQVYVGPDLWAEEPPRAGYEFGAPAGVPPAPYAPLAPQDPYAVGSGQAPYPPEAPYAPQASYALPADYAADYAPEAPYAPRADYAPQADYAPAGRYAPPVPYAPQADDVPPASYAPPAPQAPYALQAPYAPQADYAPPAPYAPQAEHVPPDRYAPPAAYAPSAPYAPQADYAPPALQAPQTPYAPEAPYAYQADYAPPTSYAAPPLAPPLPPAPPPPSGPSGPPGFEFTGQGTAFDRAASDPYRRSMLALPPTPGELADDTGEFTAARADRPATEDASRRERRERRDARDRTRPPGSTPGRDRALPSPLSVAGVKRWAVRAALPMVTMVVIGIALVAAFGGGGGAGPAPTTLSAGFPPATAASNDFSPVPADQSRGVDQVLTAAASSGTRVVAAGSQTGTRIGRAQFFVSSDGGQTWTLGTEQAPGGGQPAPGHPATLIAGGTGRWVAVGPNSVWTSATGTTWTLRSSGGVSSQAGDQVTVLRRTAAGFLAAGRTASGGPVVWTSATGTSWRRLGPDQLKLAAPRGGTVGPITAAAAYGKTTLIATSTAVWGSTNDGATWSPVTVPASNGASGSIAGLAVAGSTFVAVRPGQAQGRADAVAFTSPDGQTWKFGATITGPGRAPLTVTTVSGGSAGAAIAAGSHGAVLAFTSASGASWQAAGTLTSTTAGTVAGLATTVGGTVVAAGRAPADQGQQPVLTVDHAGQVKPVSLAAIPGAVEPELAVNGVSASGGDQVAVGSANGFPAVWFSGDAGTTWSRGTGATANVLNRAGQQQLTGVASSARGWVAVGGVRSGTAQHPVVVTSATGRTWQTADGKATLTGTGLYTSAVAAGPAGYVIVGRQVIGGRTVAAAWWSAGLTGWQRATGPIPGVLGPSGGNAQMLAVTAGGDGFTAVGSAGTRPAAWTSANGQAWRAVTLALPSSAAQAQLTQVTADGRTVVAVGTATTKAGQTTPFAAVSKDGGATWTESSLPSPGGAAAVNAVATTGGGFTAVGTFGPAGTQNVVIWTSADGQAWTANTPAVTGLTGRGVQEITALAVSGSTLTGVGFDASVASENPTIWRSPIRG